MEENNGIENLELKRKIEVSLKKKSKKKIYPKIWTEFAKGLDGKFKLLKVIDHGPVKTSRIWKKRERKDERFVKPVKKCQEDADQNLEKLKDVKLLDEAAKPKGKLKLKKTVLLDDQRRHEEDKTLKKLKENPDVIASKTKVSNKIEEIKKIFEKEMPEEKVRKKEDKKKIENLRRKFETSGKDPNHLKTGRKDLKGKEKVLCISPRGKLIQKKKELREGTSPLVKARRISLRTSRMFEDDLNSSLSHI